MKYCVVFLFVFCSLCCTEERLVEPPSQAGRTVLVYMGGDNNLSDETYTKIDSITRGWHNGRDNLLVYRDAEGAPVLLRVVGDAVQPYTQVVKEYPEHNSASATVFGEVLRDVLKMYPAPSHGLLVFSHGTGWLPEGLFGKPRFASLRSIMNDQGSEMELADFAASIPDGTFDFIVMEACLMAGVEVAYELRHKADYLVASSAEILSPGFTPLYAELMGYLFEPAPNLAAFARRYFEHADGLAGAHRSATVSVLRLGGMDALAAAARLCFAGGTLPNAAGVQCFDRTRVPLYFDLGDYMARLSPVHYPAFDEALRHVVAYQAATPSFVGLPLVCHSGLTTYIEQPAYPALNAAWHQTAWYEATHQ